MAEKSRSTPDAELFGGLTPDQWDQLAGRNFYSSANWLRFCTTDFNRKSSAVVSFRGGEPTRAIPFVEADDSLFGAYRWHDLLAERGLPAVPARGILVGPREGYQTHVLGAESCDASGDLRELTAQLRAAAAGAAPAERACVAMYATTDDVLALRHAGVAAPPVLLEADAWIEVPEGGWSAWEAALSSRKRNTVRREIRRFHDAGYRVEHVPLSQCWNRLGGLASQTLVKHGSVEESEADLMNVLGNHASCLGGSARTALLLDPHGELVGFSLYYLWHDTVFLRWVGFDYPRLRNASEYFNLTYYSQIALASDLGLRWIHAGVKSLEAKVFRGARLRPLWLVDLSEDSVLASAENRIREYNTRRYESLANSAQTAQALDEDAWRLLL